LSRVFYHPKLSATTGRPASILYLQSENLDTLADYLSRKSRAQDFDRFADINTTERDEFAYSFIVHELGLSDLYIALERSDRPESLVFWERLSPKSEATTTKLKASITTEDGTGTQTLSFNPDAFLCYRTQDNSLTFYFHEHDNNTETNLYHLYRKYAAYVAYRKERRFPAILTRFANKHGITIPDNLLSRIDFKILTTAPTAERRDKLLREVNKLEKSETFYFASLSDITPATAHSRLWYRASDYDSIAAAEKQLPKETKQSTRARFIAERIPSLPTYALGD
jgi:hypothetical protein